MSENGLLVCLDVAYVALVCACVILESCVELNSNAVLCPYVILVPRNLNFVSVAHLWIVAFV